MSVHHFTKQQVGKTTFYVCERCGEMLDKDGNTVERKEDTSVSTTS